METNRDDEINEFIYKLMLPYMYILKIILTKDDNFEKIKNNNQNKININFLEEIIKKHINNIDK